ncbi:polysaccharide deacetylase family protein [bacterium]|nr:MAG: polysaccharide deacetylase family protein [bacterium]
MLTSVGLGLLLAATPPTITPFAHGRKAAFSVEFDDAMESQIKNAFPLLAQYRIPATFYIVPDGGGYAQNREIWEKKVPSLGHELGNHTMHHSDTVGAAQAEKEIGGAAKAIEQALGKPTLTPFAIPGGVKWEIPEEDFRRILKESNTFFPGRGDFHWDGQGDILRYPKAALEKGSWGQIGFHGVGDQWLTTSVESLASLLAFLDAHRDELWIAPTGTVWKYQREREAVQSVELTPEGENAFKLALRFEPGKLAPFELYNVPLTVRISLPSEWKKVWVLIDGRKRQAAVRDASLDIDVPPSAKSVRIERA